jgi:hypothetical protein
MLCGCAKASTKHGTTQEWQVLLTASDPLPHAAPSSAAHKASKTQHNAETPTLPHEIKMAKKRKINLETANNETVGISNQQMKQYRYFAPKIELPQMSPPTLPVCEKYALAGYAAGRRCAPV